MKKFIAFLMSLLIILSLIGCEKKPSLPEKGEELTFDAVVLAIDEELGTVFVDSIGQDFTKAVISLHADTEFINADGDTIELSDLEKDDSLTITNFGLIAESYPVQMSAKKIVLN